MSDSSRRPIEGYRGYTIDRDRVVRNRHGHEVGQQIKSGTTYVAIGNVKDGTHRVVQVEEIYHRIFGPRKRRLPPSKAERDEMEHTAADLAAEGDLVANHMMENMRYAIKDRPDKVPFSLTMAAVLLGAIGQEMAGTRRNRFEEMTEWTR